MSLGEAAGRPTGRMMLTDLNTGESQEFQFNPEQIRGKLGVRYARMNVQGLSHQPLQYGGTSNRTFSFELFFLAYGPAEQDRNADAIKFIASLCYVSESSRTPSSAPPTVHLFWPNFLSMAVKVIDVSDRYFKFDRDGRPSGFAWTLQVEEQLNVRLSSERVRRVGLNRAPLMRRSSR